MKRKNTSRKRAAAVKTAQSAPAAPNLTIETRPIEQLKPYDGNPVLHPAKQIEQLRHSFRTFGQVWPLLIREDDTIIAGHGRLEAAKLEGFKEIRVIVASGWSDQQCRAFGILDNKVPENSEWDDDLLGLELSRLRVDGENVNLLGVTEKELARHLRGDDAGDGTGEGGEIEAAYQVLIECKDEAQQIELLTRLQKDGIECRALIA